MPAHTDRQVLPYTPRQMFDLVLDVEKYPEFLPWCRAARVLERGENEFLGELVISFHHLSERYTSRVTHHRPESEDGEGSIDVAMVKGPFEYLTNRWRFAPEGDGTRVDFFLDFKFRSRLLEKLIGTVFEKAASHMVDAFKQRAGALYGEKAL